MGHRQPPSHPIGHRPSNNFPMDVFPRLTMMAFVLAVLIAGALRQMGHQRAIRQWTDRPTIPSEELYTEIQSPWASSPQEMQLRFRFLCALSGRTRGAGPGQQPKACRKGTTPKRATNFILCLGQRQESDILAGYNNESRRTRCARFIKFLWGNGQID